MNLAWSLTQVTAIATLFASAAVVIAAAIYWRQLVAMRRSRELESLLVIMNQVDNMNLRLTRSFMRHHGVELKSILEQTFSVGTRAELEARICELSAQTLSIHDIDLAVNALNNVAFLIRTRYAPPKAAKAFMQNSFRLAWHSFEPCIKYRRTDPSKISDAAAYAKQFDLFVQELGEPETSPN